jgi:hypothetical protein
LKINRLFSASLLAGAVILSGTACSASPIPEGRNTPITTPASPQASSSADTTEDTTKILETVNGYYDFITSPDAKDTIKSAGADYVGKNATDEELQSFAENFSEGFQYFDTSTSTAIQNAYRSMSVGSLSLAQQEGSVTISAPKESVTIDGDTATVNSTWISATIGGKELGSAPESSPDPSDLIQLVKKDDGSWVIAASNSQSVPKPTVP